MKLDQMQRWAPKFLVGSGGLGRAAGPSEYEPRWCIPCCSNCAPQRGLTLSLSHIRKMRLRAATHSGFSVWCCGLNSGAVGCNTACDDSMSTSAARLILQYARTSH